MCDLTGVERETYTTSRRLSRHVWVHLAVTADAKGFERGLTGKDSSPMMSTKGTTEELISTRDQEYKSKLNRHNGRVSLYYGTRNVMPFVWCERLCASFRPASACSF